MSSSIDEAGTSGSSESVAPGVSQWIRKGKPQVVLVVGMAGSGKSTVLERLVLSATEQGKKSYVVNLDPAVLTLGYSPNIDIRDTVKYKEVMKQYTLGPNGAILTSLNLFATRFDQVLGFIEKRAEELDYVFVDTPGQIEAFTWSASGQIIAETLMNTFPTTMLYVVDTPRCQQPVTFMSNMMYACSIMYKFQMPFIVVFNKADVCDTDFAQDWMKDFDALQGALESETSYSGNLAYSMSLVLDEFYSQLENIGVSALTGLNFDLLFSALERAAGEFDRDVRPILEKRAAERAVVEEARREESMQRFREDFAAKTSVAAAPRDAE